MPRRANAFDAHAAWWLWLIGQATVLAIYAERIPLAGGYPRPVEATADLGLAVCQVLLATLFAPTLFGDTSRLLRATCVAVVFTALAGQLAGRSPTETVQLLAIVLLWLIAIARIGRHSLGQLALLFLTIALPVLAYASAEYRSPPLLTTSWLRAASPVLGVCTTRLHNALIGPAIWPIAGILVEAIVCRTLSRHPIACNGQPFADKS